MTMSKRVKINFETVNGDRYEILPPEKVAESRARIRCEMQKLHQERLKKMRK
jgi:hypothetical protein